MSRRVLIGAAVGAALALLALAPPAFASGLALRTDHVFKRIAGSDAHLNCSKLPSRLGAYGVANQELRMWFVLPGLCREANWFRRHQAAPYTKESFRQALALLVMTHESIHLSKTFPGAQSEAQTECLALQVVHDVAVGLGASDAVARAIGHEAMRWDATLPASYRSRACRDGGPRDVHPGLGDWPNA